MMRHFIQVLCLSVATLSALGQETITHVSEVRRMSAVEAAKNRPVLVEGQVLRADPQDRSFFIAEDGEGIYISRFIPPEEFNQEAYDAILQPKVGDWARVRGVTIPGEYTPAIDAESVDVIGWSALPKPRPFQLEDLYDAASDCDWVTVHGRLTSMQIVPTEFTDVLLTLELQESVEVYLRMVYAEGCEEIISELMYQEVQVTAVLGAVFNGRRQLTSRVLLVQSAEDFELQSEEAEVAVRDMPIQSLMTAEMDYREPVRTSGVVTYAGPRVIYLRGEESSLKVMVSDVADLRVGQTVLIEGFVWPQPITPAFRARTVKVLGDPMTIPEPRSIPFGELFGLDLYDDLFDPRLNYELVRLTAEVVDVGQAFGLRYSSLTGSRQKSLLCRAEGRLFEARLPQGMDVDAAIRPGALLELTGICNLLEDRSTQWRLTLDGLWLQVRDASDIVVVRSAPWWTPEKMLWASLASAGVFALFLAWIVMLRRTVLRQTSIIRDQVQRETTMNERQRIAQELHDTIEQSLTALSLQLKRIYKKITKDPAGGLKVVTQAETTLGICRDQSRSAIQNLRGGGLLEKTDLASAVEQTLVLQHDERANLVKMTVQGEAQRLPLFVEHHLLRMMTESASNALEHADPERVEILLTYATDTLSIEVSDDGCGFDLNILEDTPRFGVRGLYERANRLGGELRVESHKGEGTKVLFSMGLAKFLEEAG